MTDIKGITDPTGINPNPFNGKPYSDEYKELAKKWSKLPAYKPDYIIPKIKDNQVLLMIAGTGSGKSVLGVKFLLHVLGYDSHICMTLPKQLIAQSAATYAAKTLDVKIGEEVSYKFKGSPKEAYNPKSNLLYATDGTLVAQLMNDPELKQYDGVALDEVHERKVQIDFLLYLLKQVLRKRPEFKLLLMSATVDETIFKSYFNEFKYNTIYVEGASNYPVESIFVNKPLSDKEYLDRGFELIKEIVEKTKDSKDEKISKDILLFVVSINETFDMCKKLEGISDETYCIEVFSGINEEKQKIAQTKGSVVEFGKSIKLVIGTNVIESSMTIDGIKYVIDSGYELHGYYDPDKNANVLERKLITQAQAKQRMGRTGRTESGVCYHLYTKQQFDEMEKFPQPTIRVSDIYGECMKLLNIPDIHSVENLLDILSKFIEPPRESYIKSAISRLMQLKIIENNEISKIGKIIAETQLDPMQGLTLFAGYKLMCAKEVSAILSLIDVSKGNLSEIFTLPMDIVGDEDTKKLGHMKDKFNNSRLDLISKYGDHMSLYKIISKYQNIRDKEKKASDWLYKQFIKKSTLEKAIKTFKKLRGTIGQVFSNKENVKNIFPNLDMKKILNYKIEYRILACFAYGFKTNYAFYKQQTKKYDTKYAQNVSIHRDSYLNLIKKDHKEVIFNDLSMIGGRLEMSIVSTIPTKSEELLNMLI
jgi:pre-mRNA-splicing factor ATP-dependent RNA helicase DHX15/PRP43